MLESFIAAITIAAVGGVVAYAMRRIERHQDRAGEILTATLAQFKRDIDVIAGALHLHRMPDGNLYRAARRRRAD